MKRRHSGMHEAIGGNGMKLSSGWEEGKMILLQLAFCVLDISTPPVTQYQKLPTHIQCSH